MFRYLTVLLFLLILFPLLNIGDASSVSAQSFTYEDGSYWLPDIEIKGNEKKVICNCCGESFYDEDALDRHLKYKTTCRSYYGLDEPKEETEDSNDGNNNKDDYGFEGGSFCPYCGKLYEYCLCQDLVITGRDSSTDIVWNITTVINNKSNSAEADIKDCIKDSVQNLNELKVGGYYKSQTDCQKLFQDSILIPPLQTDKETCVSTCLAYSLMWLENLPIEKFDSVKEYIENNFYSVYHRELSKNGVSDFILQDFITLYSGVNAQPVSLVELKTKLFQGKPGVGTLIIKKHDGSYNGHEISIIGYDNCEKEFICKDPQKIQLINMSEEMLNSYNVVRKGKNSIFYIEKDYSINSNYHK